MLVPDSIPFTIMDFNGSAADTDKRMMERLSCAQKAHLTELKMEGCPRESFWLSTTSGAVFIRDMTSGSPRVYDVRVLEASKSANPSHSRICLPRRLNTSDSGMFLILFRSLRISILFCFSLFEKILFPAY
jgi:hypothetical protein